MQLVWFRNDLRIADNTALWQACESGSPVSAIFFITPQQWQAHCQSAVQVEFRLRCLAELAQSLKKLGIPLQVETASDFSVLPKKLLGACKDLSVEAVHFNNEYPLDEWRRDEAVSQLLAENDIDCFRFHDRTLLPPGSVRNNSGQPYKVFTPFKKRYLAIIEESGDVDVLPQPKSVSRKGEFVAPEIPDSLPGFNCSIAPALWPAGEKAAQQALETFGSERIAEYAEQRDYPAVNGTSQLSHHLAVGTISPRQCLQAALIADNENPQACKSISSWISELIWRDFYQHIVFDFPEVCKYQPFKPETDAIPWRDSEDDFAAWCEGKTGVPIVDAGMRQLQEIGWMHNRVRMITAMYLTKNLLIDWRKGERFFMSHLVDGDFASNNGGWQWSASTGTDAAPYFRIFNPFEQAKRFDAEADYIRHYVPELRNLEAKVIHNPDKLEKLRPKDYPAQRVDLRSSRQRAIDAFKFL